MAVTPCGRDLSGADWLTATNDNDRQERVVYYKQGQPPTCYTQSPSSPVRSHCQMFHGLYRRVVRRLHQATDCGSVRSEKHHRRRPQVDGPRTSARESLLVACVDRARNSGLTRGRRLVRRAVVRLGLVLVPSLLSRLILPPGCCRSWTCPRVWQLRSERCTKYRSSRSCGRITRPASSGHCPGFWSVSTTPKQRSGWTTSLRFRASARRWKKKPGCRITGDAHSMFSRRQRCTLWPSRPT